MRKIVAVCSSWVMLLLCFWGTLPAEAAKTLPPGMVIGDSDGIYATPEGDYYIDMVDILPGDTFKKEITIRSLDLEEPFPLGLLVEEIDSKGSVDWKEHITMTLTLDGKEMYQGPLLGDGSRDWTVTPLELGVCEYGTDKLLTAVFTADSSLTNEDLREASTLSFSWIFVATMNQPTEPTAPTEPTQPSTVREPKHADIPKTSNGNKLYPQTGEELVYTFLTGLLLVLIVLFLWKKRREEEQG